MIAQVCRSARSWKGACKSRRDCGHSLIRTAPPAAGASWDGSATESGTARVWSGGIEEAMPRLFPLCSHDVPALFPVCSIENRRHGRPFPVFSSIEMTYAHAQNCRLCIFLASCGTREHGERISESTACDRNRMG